MTIEQMNDVIQMYCSLKCDKCLIESLCTPIKGDFIDHAPECRAAFEIISQLPKTPDETANPAQDNVNHPAHYETGKFECIEVMREALGEDVVKGFCLGNAFKYLYRCNHKHQSPLEDVKKAIWYLDKFVDLEG